MTIYLNKTIPVRVSIDGFVGPTPVVVADKGRTAGGVVRADIAYTYHEWKVNCKKLSYDEWKAIYDHLESILYSETLFWCEDFGGTPDTNSKCVEVEFSDPKLVAFGTSGGWQKSGRDITLTIRESRSSV